MMKIKALLIALFLVVSVPASADLNLFYVCDKLVYIQDGQFIYELDNINESTAVDLITRLESDEPRYTINLDKMFPTMRCS